MPKTVKEQVLEKAQQGKEWADFAIDAWVGADPDNEDLADEAEEVRGHLRRFWYSFQDLTDENRRRVPKKEKPPTSKVDAERQEILPHTEDPLKDPWGKPLKCPCRYELFPVFLCAPDRHCVPCRTMCGVGPGLRPSEAGGDPSKANLITSVLDAEGYYDPETGELLEEDSVTWHRPALLDEPPRRQRYFPKDSKAEEPETKMDEKEAAEGKKSAPKSRKSPAKKRKRTKRSPTPQEKPITETEGPEVA